MDHTTGSSVESLSANTVCQLNLHILTGKPLFDTFHHSLNYHFCLRFNHICDKQRVLSGNKTHCPVFGSSFRQTSLRTSISAYLTKHERVCVFSECSVAGSEAICAWALHITHTVRVKKKIHPKALILRVVRQTQMMWYHSKIFQAQLQSPFVGENLSSVQNIISKCQMLVSVPQNQRTMAYL